MRSKPNTPRPFEPPHPHAGATRNASRLTIHCLGTLTLDRGGRPIALPTRRTGQLLAYLILHGGRLCSRDTVCEALWEDVPLPQARKLLRTELWRLRDALELRAPRSPAIVRVLNGHLAFPPHRSHWVDLDQFQRELVAARAERSQPLTDRQARHLQSAVALYRGDLCEGISAGWVAPERERFQHLLCNALERLIAHAAARHQWDLAIDYAQRILGRDPLLEHVHRAVMRFYYIRGDRPAALRQYQRCADVLRRELDVRPMPDTERLYQGMRNGTVQWHVTGRANVDLGTMPRKTYNGNPNAVDCGNDETEQNAL
jgi:DNA-binding SARP family transcriptional activator